MHRIRVLVCALALAASLVAIVDAPAPAAAAVPAGFTEVTAFRGLVQPTAVRFAPDGRIFVAEKRGTIVMYDGVSDTTPTRIADLRTEVHNYWDRGLLGLAIDPGFPARPYLYASYTFDGPIGGTAPRWGTPGADSDPCPTPPGPTSDGCVVSGKLVRLTLNGTTTTKQDLINDWCQQYPSHTVGDLAFGPDGALYASGGDGANFNIVDYGQDGSPTNPCGDPPGGVGGAMTPPTAQGGALRAQDLRTTGDPVTLDGTVIRVSPDTGAALSTNPNATATDANARRIIAHGLRNPFRLAFRPGTSEVWLGDVGWNTWEEINRIATPTSGVRNYGWPCFEGNARQPGYDAADLSICENLYSQGGDTKPFFAYQHGRTINANDTCDTASGASSSGVAFQFYSGGPYPAEYDGALFFADYSRKCIWVMTRGTGTLPETGRIRPFVSAAAAPVDLEISPQGELFYADLDGGTIRRIVYTGSGVTSCPSGQYLAEYFTNTTLTGTPARSACEPPPLAHDFQTGGPAGVGSDNFSARWSGTFDFAQSGDYLFTARSDDGIRVWVDGALAIDAWRVQGPTTYTATRTLTAGAHAVRVEYYEATGGALVELSWAAQGTGDAPVPSISTPAAGTTWRVGQTITFSGSATDPQDGTLPASALSWQAVLMHCPSACHAHPLQSWSGVSGGSFAAPDHEYPSHLELRLTATDSDGRSTTVIRRLDPQTVPVTLNSLPSGLSLTLGARTAVTPFTTTMIVGSAGSLSAPSPQTLFAGSYTFSSWSDGGAQSHDFTAGTAATTLTATYNGPCASSLYRAQYFPNKTLSGTAVTTRCESAPLTRNFGSGAAPGTGVDNFSARWLGKILIAGGTRTFTAQSDDGMRVWLDGVLIVDRWASQGTTQVTRAVTAGLHTIRVEYWEGVSSASVSLTWA